MASVAIFGPVAFTIGAATSGETRFEVVALTWHLIIRGDLVFFTLISQASVVLSPLIFFRLGFVHQLYQCYKANVTKTRAVLMGVLSELPIFLFIALTWIPNLGAPYILDMPTIGPIPHLLMFALILLYLAPPVEPRQWIEEIPSITKW